MEGSKMKGNFTDFHQNIIEKAGLAPENAGLPGDEYDLYMGGHDHHFTHVSQSAHFRRYGSGLMSEASRKSMEPIAFKTSNDD
jgi:hypothetical protein